jgi:hypothetical protein
MKNMDGLEESVGYIVPYFTQRDDLYFHPVHHQLSEGGDNVRGRQL